MSLSASLSRRVLTLALAATLPCGLAAPHAGAQAPAASAAAGTMAHDAKDISGDWQGTLQTPKQPLRLILRVTKTDKGFAGKVFSIDQRATPLTSSVTLTGNAMTYTVEAIGVTYKGTVSPDGNTITGTFNQGGTDIPLTYVRATKETAWEIPAPPAPVKRMAADANPSFDVATIKPNDSGGSTLQQLTLNGRDFVTRNASLADLMSFAYAVQGKQIVNAPDWVTKDRYDIKAVPDTEGAPDADQLRMMIRKLLTERFQLKFHHDKRELSAYVLTVDKGGQKLKPTELSGPLPGIGFQPRPSGLGATASNAMISDFTGFLQTIVLDRPVVDRTGLTGRYDFTIVFTPDDTEFNGRPPKLPVTEGVEPAPDLFTAMQAQLGLKLEAQKTAVDVLAVDKAEKPTAN